MWKMTIQGYQWLQGRHQGLLLNYALSIYFTAGRNWAKDWGQNSPDNNCHLVPFTEQKAAARNLTSELGKWLPSLIPNSSPCLLCSLWAVLNGPPLPAPCSPTSTSDWLLGSPGRSQDIYSWGISTWSHLKLSMTLKWRPQLHWRQLSPRLL